MTVETMTKTMKIAYLGPKGSYTHIAASAVFANGEVEATGSDEFVALNSITETIEKLNAGEIDQAILPIENSIEGGVGETVDALIKTEEVYVSGEFVLPIKHNLLAKAGTKSSDLKQVFAHPMSFGQCRDFLMSHCKDAHLTNKSSNSAAAKFVSESEEEGNSAIGSELCAKLYNLDIVAPEINDKDNNETRFWILSRKPVAYKAGEDYKTSIVFQATDKPGSLINVLEPISKSGINLSRIESRPSKEKLGEYMFLMDLDLHKEDEKFNAVFKDIQMHFTFYKWLGSYSVTK